MDIRVSHEDNAMLVTVTGRLDSITSGELETWAKETLTPAEENVVMDFSQLDYISSAGLRAMLNISRLITAASRTFSLCSVQDHVKEVFEISGFDSFIPIYATIEEALAK